MPRVGTGLDRPGSGFTAPTAPMEIDPTAAVGTTVTEGLMRFAGGLADLAGDSAAARQKIANSLLKEEARQNRVSAVQDVHSNMKNVLTTQFTQWQEDPENFNIGAFRRDISLALIDSFTKPGANNMDPEDLNSLQGMYTGLLDDFTKLTTMNPNEVKVEFDVFGNETIRAPSAAAINQTHTAATLEVMGSFSPQAIEVYSQMVQSKDPNERAQARQMFNNFALLRGQITSMEFQSTYFDMLAKGLGIQSDQMAMQAPEQAAAWWNGQMSNLQSVMQTSVKSLLDNPSMTGQRAASEFKAGVDSVIKGTQSYVTLLNQDPSLDGRFNRVVDEMANYIKTFDLQNMTDFEKNVLKNELSIRVMGVQRNLDDSTLFAMETATQAKNAALSLMITEQISGVNQSPHMREYMLQTQMSSLVRDRYIPLVQKYNDRIPLQQLGSEERAQVSNMMASDFNDLWSAAFLTFRRAEAGMGWNSQLSIQDAVAIAQALDNNTNYQTYGPALLGATTINGTQKNKVQILREFKNKYLNDPEYGIRLKQLGQEVLNQLSLNPEGSLILPPQTRVPEPDNTGEEPESRRQVELPPAISDALRRRVEMGR